MSQEEEPFLDEADKQISTGNKIDIPTSQQEQVDLKTARTILQAIVNTHENTFVETTPLDRIAGHSTKQVRQAEKIVAQSLVEKSTYTFRHNPPITVFLKKKGTPQGELILSLTDESASLKLRHEREWVLENDYALEQPEGNMEHTIGFSDYRHGGNEATLHDLKKREPSLQGIRHMWRGLRWMNANMLDWDNPNTIMPEQLDTLPLPPSQGK